MNILAAASPALAEQISKAVAKVTTHAETLKWIAKAEGDVYLNIEKSFYEGPLTEFCLERNPAAGRNVEMHSGPNAAAHAHDSVADSDDERDPRPGYLTTIILHPDGTWSERYLFRL